jgi:hypothetical protein
VKHEIRMNLFFQKDPMRQVGYCDLHGSDVLRPGLVTTIFLILVIACAWTAVAMVMIGLCVLAARGDRTLRAGVSEPAGQPAGQPTRHSTRLRLIA